MMEIIIQFYSQSNSTYISYQNVIRYDVPTTSGNVITRNTAYSIEVTCNLVREENPENNLLPVANTAPPARGDGQFDVRMTLYLNNRLEQLS